MSIHSNNSFFGQNMSSWPNIQPVNSSMALQNKNNQQSLNSNSSHLLATFKKQIQTAKSSCEFYKSTESKLAELNNSVTEAETSMILRQNYSDTFNNYMTNRPKDVITVIDAFNEKNDKVDKEVTLPVNRLIEMMNKKDKKLWNMKRRNEELVERLHEAHVVIDLIMNKYRDQGQKLLEIEKSRANGDFIRLPKNKLHEFRTAETNERVRLENKLSEMMNVMSTVVEKEENAAFQAHQRITELETHNQGLKETLSESKRARNLAYLASKSKDYCIEGDYRSNQKNDASSEENSSLISINNNSPIQKSSKSSSPLPLHLRSSPLRRSPSQTPQNSTLDLITDPLKSPEKVVNRFSPNQSTMLKAKKRLPSTEGVDFRNGDCDGHEFSRTVPYKLNSDKHLNQFAKSFVNDEIQRSIQNLQWFGSLESFIRSIISSMKLRSEGVISGLITPFPD